MSIVACKPLFYREIEGAFHINAYRKEFQAEFEINYFKKCDHFVTSTLKNGVFEPNCGFLIHGFH